MKTTLIAAAALALAGFPALAHAQSGALYGPVPTLDVPYGDLNLSNPLGAATMLRRIRQAASLVCGGQPDIRDLPERAHHRQCVRAATDGAVAQLDAPLVTALYTGRRPNDPRYAQDGVATRR